MFIGLGLALTRQSGRGSPPAFVNTVAPAITGVVEDGETLSVTNGTWTPSPAGYTYQWKRDGVNIDSATSSTYALVLADVGALINCIVTANDGGSGTTPAESNTVGPVDPAPDAEYLELYAGGNLSLYGGGNLELYAAVSLALYAGGFLELYGGGTLELYEAVAIPARALLLNGAPVLLNGQYILV